MNSEVVRLVEIESGIAQITLQDRVTKNAFSSELVVGLLAAFATIRADARYRAVILTGYDTYFCSGGTQAGLLQLQAGEGTFLDANIYSQPLDCEIPVIAAMQGHGIGGGLVLGLFADCVVFSRESVYTANFMKYGFTPGMGATFILPKKLGVGLSHEMLLSARTYRGAELEKRGLPFPVLPRGEVLDHAVGLARDLAEKPRDSLVTLKRHLVSEMRSQLPNLIEQELAMHEKTFHLPEVKERIEKAYGK